MSTANFAPMEYGMPLVCGGLYSFKEYQESMKKDFDEEVNEDMFYMCIQDDFDYAAQIAEDFSDLLTFHEVTIKAGYYQGFQFVVTEKYEAEFDLNADSKYCIDNDDAHYYFDMYRSQALRKADAEKRKISKWLENLKNQGYKILICAGRFSNGEAIYTEI